MEEKNQHIFTVFLILCTCARVNFLLQLTGINQKQSCASSSPLPSWPPLCQHQCLCTHMAMRTGKESGWQQIWGFVFITSVWRWWQKYGTKSKHQRKCLLLAEAGLTENVQIHTCMAQTIFIIIRIVKETRLDTILTSCKTV